MRPPFVPDRQTASMDRPERAERLLTSCRKDAPPGRRQSRMNYSFTVPSLLILIIIAGYFFLRPRLQIRLNRAFLALLAIDIGTVLFDYVSSRMDENWMHHGTTALWIANLLFFIFYLTRVYLFYVFTVSVLDTRGAVRSRLSAWAPAVYFACFLVAVSSPVTHWLFRIDADGYHAGPLYFLMYVCSGAYLLFSMIAILRSRRNLLVSELIGLLAIQVPLLLGNILRALYPHFLIMNTFCLLSILIIFLSFQNPEFFLAERGYVYNMKALQAILLERTQRKIPCRILGFAVQNYTEHREFFGSARMDEAMGRINRYLATEYRGLTAFYLRNGCYALLGSGSTDLDALTARLEQRFAEPWKTRDGELPLKLSFVQADTEQLSCSADRLANTLRISLNEAVNGSRIAGRRMLSDSLGAIEQRLDIRHCLEKALEEDALEVFLQPIVESETGRWIAAEALVRIRNEAGGLIPPEQFISLAEHEGQIVKLGEQVLSKVCAFIQAHDLAGLGLSWINVNLSPMQFLSQQIPERFSEILARWGVSPRQLHLEITEQSLTDFSLLRTQINSLHGKGFEFALDDYGSGYSNLIRVMQYPFSHIKIDMEVVQNYCREQSPLLPALIQVFKQMNFSVTAEGIETKEMADALRRIGCDYFQGFYFSRPVPMEEFLSMKA